LKQNEGIISPQRVNKPLSTLKITEIRGGGGAVTSKEVSSTISTSIINLVNNVAGAGILSLSAGMAAGVGWVPAMIICTIMGMLSAHTFSMIGYSCYYTGESTFKGLCEKTLGKESAWILDFLICISNFLGGLIYAGIIGDVFTPLFGLAGLPESLNFRASNIFAISATVLLPLALMKKLTFLAYTSSLGCLAVAYVVVFLGVRAFDGSYAPGGAFVASLAEDLKPKFDGQSMFNCGLPAMVLISNLGLAFIAHFNAPRYYMELRDHSPARFNVVVYSGFVLLTVLHAVVMALGYMTFGDNSRANIMLNFSPQDVLATIGRVAVGFSILFGFPMEFIGLRDAITGMTSCLLELKEEKRGKANPTTWMKFLGWCANPDNSQTMSIVLLAVMTSMAAAISDIGITVGICGAFCGATTTFIMPALIYYYAKRQHEARLSPVQRKKSLAFELGYLPFGTFVAVLGCIMTVIEGSAGH